MNYIKQLLCFQANDGNEADITSNETNINEEETNKNTEFKKFFNDEIITSDSSDIESNTLVDSTENLSLVDVHSEISGQTRINNKESMNKVAKEIPNSEHAKDDCNANHKSISDDDVKINGSKDNNILIHMNKDGPNSTSMSINDTEDTTEIQVIEMDIDDISEDSNKNPDKTTPNDEQLNNIDQNTETDINNNTEILTQFIENNIADFVQSPRNISEILTSLIEFDMTPNNSFNDFQANNNNVQTCDDDYVLMDLDAIVDEIESIDSYIHNISNSHNMEDFNAITPQDMDNILNDNLNVDTSLQHSDIDANNSSKNSMPLEKTDLQDFELQIDLISSSKTIFNRNQIPAPRYDFNIQIDVENVSSQYSDNVSQEAESIIIADSTNNSFIANENINSTEEQRDQVLDDKLNEDSTTNKIIKTSINTGIKKHANVKIIDIITLSSSDEDDEDNYPLALIKKKYTNTTSDHISISSNDSVPNKDDLDYCSGYESSDFEFITESEAKKAGITYRKASKDKESKQPSKKTLQTVSIERVDSRRSVTDYFPNQTGPGGLRHHFDYISSTGLSGLNKNVNKPLPTGLNSSANKPGSSGIYNNVNKTGQSGLNKVNNVVPSGVNSNTFKPSLSSLYKTGPTGLYYNVYTPAPSGSNKAASKNAGSIGLKCNPIKPIPSDLNNSNYKPGSSFLNTVYNVGRTGLNRTINKPGFIGLNNSVNEPGPSGLIAVNNAGRSGYYNNVNKPSPSGFNNRSNNPDPTGFNNYFNKLGPTDLNNSINKPGSSGLNNSIKPGPSGLNNNMNIPSPSGLNNSIKEPSFSGLLNSINKPSPSFLNNSIILGSSGLNNWINKPGPSGLNNNMNILGPSGLNDSIIEPGPNGLNNSINKPGPSGLNNIINNDLNNKASTEDHVIPQGEEYLNLFQGMYDRTLRPNSYALENKSLLEPNPTIPGMFIDMHGAGFDMAARQNQPYDEDIDDETRAEARENRNRILQMYPGDNRKRRRRR